MLSCSQSPTISDDHPRRTPGGPPAGFRTLPRFLSQFKIKMAAGKKIFWDHCSKSLVTIQVFTSETWAPTRLKNGGKFYVTAIYEHLSLQYGIRIVLG